MDPGFIMLRLREVIDAMLGCGLLLRGYGLRGRAAKTTAHRNVLRPCGPRQKSAEFAATIICQCTDQGAAPCNVHTQQRGGLRSGGFNPQEVGGSRVLRALNCDLVNGADVEEGRHCQPTVKR